MNYSNLNNVNRFRNGFRRKEAALEHVALIFKSKQVINDSIFLSDVVRSSSYGWTVQSFGRSFYDEILNTGKLGIINNLEVRNAITQLYNFFQLYERVSLPRTSDYSQIIYSVVPMKTDIVLKPGLDDQERKDIVEALMNLDLNKYLIFEQNRIRFLRSFYDHAEIQITGLKDLIETDLGISQ